MGSVLRRLHPFAGIAAMVLIAAFWGATVIVEVGGDGQAIARVKGWIVGMLPALVLALAIAGASGFRLGRLSRHPTVTAKKRRMPLIAANGLLVLVPLAIVLADRAASGRIDGVFYALQAAELLAGALNLTLLALMARDGRRLAGIKSTGRNAARVRR